MRVDVCVGVWWCGVCGVCLCYFVVGCVVLCRCGLGWSIVRSVWLGVVCGVLCGFVVVVVCCVCGWLSVCRFVRLCGYVCG